jgi:hypothetical protein
MLPGVFAFPAAKSPRYGPRRLAKWIGSARMAAPGSGPHPPLDTFVPWGKVTLTDRRHRFRDRGLTAVPAMVAPNEAARIELGFARLRRINLAGERVNRVQNRQGLASVVMA